MQSKAVFNVICRTGCFDPRRKYEYNISEVPNRESENFLSDITLLDKHVRDLSRDDVKLTHCEVS